VESQAAAAPSGSTSSTVRREVERERRALLLEHPADARPNRRDAALSPSRGGRLDPGEQLPENRLRVADEPEGRADDADPLARRVDLDQRPGEIAEGVGEFVAEPGADDEHDVGLGDQLAVGFVVPGAAECQRVPLRNRALAGVRRGDGRVEANCQVEELSPRARAHGAPTCDEERPFRAGKQRGRTVELGGSGKSTGLPGSVEVADVHLCRRMEHVERHLDVDRPTRRGPGTSPGLR